MNVHSPSLAAASTRGYSCLALALGAWAAVAVADDAPWGVVPGALRLKATFETRPPQADLSAGEKRMTRMWGGTDYNRPPDDGSKGRVALSKCLVSGRTGGTAFSPVTERASCTLQNRRQLVNKRGEILLG